MGEDNLQTDDFIWEDLEPLDPNGPVNPNMQTQGQSGFDPESVLTSGKNWTADDSRARERHDWCVTLMVELVEGLRHDENDGLVRNRDGNHRTIKVTTEDLSTGGFAFTHQSFIHPGTAVRVQLHMLPNKPVYMGVVRHCNNIGGMQHRIGVQFNTHPV